MSGADKSLNQWHADMLRSLAKQFEADNDYFWPLIGAAELLDNQVPFMTGRMRAKPVKRRRR
jgi:hypothetical protein